MHQLSQIERVCLADLYDLAMSGEISPQTFVRRGLGGAVAAALLGSCRSVVPQAASIAPDWNALDADVDGRVILPSWRPAVAEPDVRQRRELSASV